MTPTTLAKGEDELMNPTTVLATCSIVLLLTVVALIREHRLRRALQRLLYRLITLWPDHPGEVIRCHDRIQTAG